MLRDANQRFTTTLGGHFKQQSLKTYEDLYEDYEQDPWFRVRELKQESRVALFDFSYGLAQGVTPIFRPSAHV